MDYDSIIGNVGLIFSASFFSFACYKYILYWKQLKSGFSESGRDWPLFEQSTLNTAARADLHKGANLLGNNIEATMRLLLSLRSDDPRISEPLRKIRRLIIAFALFPFFLGIILLLTATIFAA